MGSLYREPEPYEDHEFYGGPCDGQLSADNRRLQESVGEFFDEGRLMWAFYRRTTEVRHGRVVYRFCRTETPAL